LLVGRAHGRWGRAARRGLTLGAVLACALPLVQSPAWAGEEQPPTIVNAQALDITEDGATLELRINPQGAETSYEAWLECQQATENAAGCGAVTGGPHEVGGTFPPSSEVQMVDVAMTGLDPGFTYLYRVAASNAAGRTEEEPQLPFETFAQGACGPQGCPLRFGVSLAAIEAGRRVAAKAVEEAERARTEAARLEAQRRQEEEVIARRNLEVALVPTVPSQHVDVGPALCRVPALRGHTLSGARRLLRAAHCRLGRVTAVHGAQARLVVRSQHPHRGKALAAGGRVSVTLGR
jgi:hypothetical protein